jgi:hypothetical protein
MAKLNPQFKPKLARYREGAAILGVSESQVRRFVNAGVIRAVDVPGIRAKRLVVEELEALVDKWASSSLRGEEVVR